MDCEAQLVSKIPIYTQFLEFLVDFDQKSRSGWPSFWCTIRVRADITSKIWVWGDRYHVWYEPQSLPLDRPI